MTVNAKIHVNFGIKEPLFILMHGNALFGTTLHTSVAASTFLFICDINHRLALLIILCSGEINNLCSESFMLNFQISGMNRTENNIIPTMNDEIL